MHLPFDDLVRVNRINKLSYQILNDETFWRDKILQDFPFASLPKECSSYKSLYFSKEYHTIDNLHILKSQHRACYKINGGFYDGTNLSLTSKGEFWYYPDEKVPAFTFDTKGSDLLINYKDKTILQVNRFGILINLKTGNRCEHVFPFQIDHIHEDVLKIPKYRLQFEDLYGNRWCESCDMKELPEEWVS